MQTSHTTSRKILTQSIAVLLKSFDVKLEVRINGGLIFQKVDGPASKGHMKLRNTNPRDNPSVTFNYYQEPEDLNKCVKGLNTIIRMINSKAFSKYKYPGVTARDAQSHVGPSHQFEAKARDLSVQLEAVLHRHRDECLALPWRLPSWKSG